MAALRGHGPLALTVPAQQLDDGRTAVTDPGLQPVRYLEGLLFLGRRKNWPVDHIPEKRIDQGRQPVIQRVEPFQVVDDAFVGAQGAGGQRCGARLVDLDQAPIT